MYKGYKVFKVGEMIGNKFHAHFYYAAKLVNQRYIKSKLIGERKTLEELTEYVDDRM